MNDSVSSSLPAEVRRGRLVAGSVLLAVAASAMAAPYLPPGLAGRSFLPFLAVMFIVWAALARVRGLLVPGGVLLGVGVGAWLQSLYGPAAFLFALAGGFGAVALLSALIFGADRRMAWPLFPAGGLVLAGFVVSGGPEVREKLRAAQEYWPWVLAAVALALIVSALRGPKH